MTKDHENLFHLSDVVFPPHRRPKVPIIDCVLKKQNTAIETK